MSSSSLTSIEMEHLRDVVALGFENAAEGLSTMVGREIKVVSPSLRMVRVEDVPGLIGRPDMEVVAIYLKVSGDIKGHIMLILSLEAADDLVTMLMGSKQEGASRLQEVERSALGEVANVTGSFFLGALADRTNLLIQPSPPAVIVDMAGAALDVPLAPLAMSMEDVLIIDTWFIDNERRIKSLFLVFPDIDSLSLLLGRLEQKHG